jgi:endonuclease/exonuclease/phosphatase family metal-dependent hydrolase
LPSPPSHRYRRFLVLAAAGVCTAASPTLAQLRVGTWNVSGYNGSNREQEFKTAIYASFQGRQFAPDILLAQEIRTEAGLSAFRQILNTAPGSPGDWAMGPFLAGPDGNSHGFFYRQSKVTYLGMTVVALGGPETHPRHIQRFDIRPAGYTGDGAVLACYGTHMKAGSASGDQQRRLIEAQIIRGDAENLPAGWNFLLAGDFNMQSSTQTAYQHLVGAQINDAGRFFDPIRTPGNWNNNVQFRFVHTQAPGGNPATTSGMDDRLDFILLSGSLLNGQGFNYIGSLTLPYSTTTWNDPNHSYRVWGNDGSFYDQSITIVGNQMVGQVIAQALYDATSTDAVGGHLPVFLDLRVPPKVQSLPALDFGNVALGAPAQLQLNVRNGGDVALWSAAGIATLLYSLEASPGFSAPVGGFASGAGAPGINHIITMETSTPGPRQGTITILSNAPDEPARVVIVTGRVLAPCYANCDQSTAQPVLNIDDFTCFINAFALAQTLPPALQATSYANCDQSTAQPVLNIEDFMCFVNAYALGCP